MIIKFQMLLCYTQECIFILKKNDVVKILVFAINLLENYTPI